MRGRRTEFLDRLADGTGDRAGGVGDETTPQQSAAPAGDRAGPTRLLSRARLVALAVGGFLLPWCVLLSMVLPATAQAQHWSLAWTGLDAAEALAALDEWRAGQIPGELELVNRFIRDVREHGRWAKASRADGYYTAEGLDALFEEYMTLLSKYGYGRDDAPPGARLMQLRMFYLPDEPAGPPAGS